MNSIEELLRKAMHAHANRFDPRPEPWENLEARSVGRPRPSVHLIVVSLIVVLAAGSVLVLRLLSDREPGGLRVVAPPLPSPSAAITFPSPTFSPSPDPSLTPEPSPSDGGDWTSPDGAWSLHYPAGWFLRSAGKFAGTDSWNLTSFRPGTGEGSHLDDGEFKITLSVSQNTDGWSLDDLLKFYCDGAGDPEVKILDCRKVEYGDETWAWALGHDEVYGGNTDVFAGFILDGKLYQATAIVPDGSGEQTGRSTVEDIFGTFTIG